MTLEGSEWTVTLPAISWGTRIEYKFKLNNAEVWVEDPANPSKVDDGYGGYNSLIASLTCESWTCDIDTSCDDPGEGGAGGSGGGGGDCVGSGFSDWRDAVLYFVFTDRFADGSTANNGSPTPGVEKPADYQGGDFAGITKKINECYFNNLGVNALWISPPMDNTDSAGKGLAPDTHQYSAYHGYWIRDAEKTEARFGTMAELKDMVNAAHAKGIKVLFDYPMNHVHLDAPVYKTHPDWFNQPPCICGAGCSWDGDQGKICWFADYLPDFNFKNAQARAWSVGNALWWLDQTGIDGFRLDAAKHIEDQWFLDFRTELNKKGKYYLVGETYTGNRDLLAYYVKPTMLDGQFEFALRSWIVATILTRKEPMGQLDNDLNTYESKYGAQAIMSTFVGNHDVPRPIHFAENTPLFGGNVWADGKDRAWSGQPGQPGNKEPYERLASAFTVLFTIRGVPLIYYGDEIGLKGAGDPDNRLMMTWSGTNAHQNMLRDHIKKLGKIRAEQAPLRRGTRTKIHLTSDVYAYKMSEGGKDVYVVINRSDAQQSVSGVPSGLTNLLTNSKWEGGTVPARSSMILVP